MGIVFFLLLRIPPQSMFVSSSIHPFRASNKVRARKRSRWDTLCMSCAALHFLIIIFRMKYRGKKTSPKNLLNKLLDYWIEFLLYFDSLAEWRLALLFSDFYMWFQRGAIRYTQQFWQSENLRPTVEQLTPVIASKTFNDGHEVLLILAKRLPKFEHTIAESSRLGPLRRANKNSFWSIRSHVIQFICSIFH